MLDLYSAAPADWHVVITDIRGSTKAIEEGRYKDVNTLGASTIIAMLNALGQLEIPFVFGGDGATLLVPESSLAACRKALRSSQILAKEAFNMELRVGIVPVEHLLRDKKSVLVAKIAISPTYTQAMFAGGGIAAAEALVKDPSPDNPFLVQSSGEADAKLFEGLECRWSDVRSPGFEILSLLIVARSPTPNGRSNLYQQSLQTIERIFQAQDTPIRPKSVKLSFSPRRLLSEARVRTVGRGVVARFAYLVAIFLGNILGAYLFSKPGVRLGTDWQKYKQDLLTNTDSKKFDDTLRMILTSTLAQKEELIRWLDKKKTNHELYYGLHASSHALMTCLVFDRQGRHIHFVDGGDGGYAAAAKVLKQQIKG